MLQLTLSDATVLLGRTPAALEALLDDLPEAWIGATEGAGTWSAYDVVGHLLHAERVDWMTRVRHILEHGEAVAFAPLDRMAQFESSRAKTLHELIKEFRVSRRASLKSLEALGLTAADLARRGLHPKLGRVTLGNLLATWAMHDINHLHQISRTLATQYRDAVGPWVKFLGVMHCDGHGA